MRAGRNASIIIENNQFIGFDLGSDFCAEHEWGVEKLLNSFNVDRNKIGVDRRKVNIMPNSLVFMPTTYKNIKCYLLAYLPFCRTIEDLERIEGSLHYLDLTDTNSLKETGLITAWDDHSFAILVTDKYKEELRELHDAFINLQVIIGFSDRKFFRNAGLTILIKSKLSKDMIDNCKNKDLDQIALEKAAKKTKIEKILKKAGKQYLALSPRWKDDTKTEVIFWLNPYHQDVDNFGWYTVQDLKDWTRGIGKVPKK